MDCLKTVKIKNKTVMYNYICMFKSNKSKVHPSITLFMHKMKPCTSEWAVKNCASEVD